MRVVVKIGTSLIAPGGRIDTRWMRSLVDQLDLVRHEYVIVSSGAIACGMSSLGISHKPRKLDLMQHADDGDALRPRVNENDSVSVRELEGAFGDNDELSALVAAAVQADWLVLLTNVDGFYHQNGKGKPKLVRVIKRVTPGLEASCNGKSQLGRGGMRSKLRAALRATASGIHVGIGNGTHPGVIPLMLEHRIGTYFPPLRVKE